jgi:hypothetical protein
MWQEFDRTRRVRDNENAVGKLFEQSKTTFDDVQKQFEEILNKSNLGVEIKDRLRGRILTAIWHARWEDASCQHTYDAGYGLKERFKPETFGKQRQNDQSNWVSGYHLEMKYLFVRVIEPMITQLLTCRT